MLTKKEFVFKFPYYHKIYWISIPVQRITQFKRKSQIYLNDKQKSYTYANLIIWVEEINEIKFMTF